MLNLAVWILLASTAAALFFGMLWIDRKLDERQERKRGERMK